MERLTEKKENGRFSYYVPIAENITVKMENKLGKFEDFMEEQGFESLDTFRTAIKLNQLMNKAGVEHFKENQELKARWEKLKDFINTFKEHNIDEANLAWNILDKMRELEKNQLIDDMAKALVDAKRGRKNADKPF